MQRVAFTGVSHWHIPLYLDPAIASPDMDVVGVADPDPAYADKVAAQAACPAWTDWRTMLDATRPDFVFVLGRHCDMAEVAAELIARRIPFAIEKPCGLDLMEVTKLAAAAKDADAFVSVPFVLRDSDWMQTIRRIAGDEPVINAAFKFIGGSVDRYRVTGCDWMLDRKLSGGGVLLNLGVHFLDLARLLFPTAEVKVAGAVFTNLEPGLDTEEHAAVLLQAGSGICLVETGYTYPAPHMTFDLHYSIRTAKHYFATSGSDTLEITTADQHRTVLKMPLTNPPYYPAYVRDVVARAAAGQKPVADLDDMVADMALLEAAYAFPGRG